MKACLLPKLRKNTQNKISIPWNDNNQIDKTATNDDVIYWESTTPCIIGLRSDTKMAAVEGGYFQRLYAPLKFNTNNF